MRVFVLGKVGSITHWLEDCVAALRAEGHEIRVGATRNPRLSLKLESLALSPRIGSPMAGALAGAVRRFSPDLVLVIGAYHVPPVILEALAGLRGKPPLIGWVGDTFLRSADAAARLLDAVAYTDTGLLARHATLGFQSPALYLPHAVNPHVAPPIAALRRPMMVLIANPTRHRRAVVGALTAPMVLLGPAWTPIEGADHEIHARRVAPGERAGLYGGHLAALNIRNELNVLDGLNQRNFDPCLFATPVVAEHQPDLAACFEPGSEALVWRTGEELDALYARLRAAPAEAAAVGERARRRVLADHTYAARLETLKRLL